MSVENVSCILVSSFNLLIGRINIGRYNLLRADHPNDNKRGGVCMYFEEHLPILRCEDLCNLSKKSFPTCFYRVLTSLIHSVLILLSNINDLNPTSSTVIGDFNASSSKW